tara:strand:+ start:25 stop:303 length:279 start_codon:yes stop_codon:yes gene_type:complete
MRQCIRCRAVGRVQGVWFRARTRDQALILQIAGWAENRPDGSVEVFACGERAKLEELQAWLQEGPPLARVRSLEVAEAESQMLNGVTGFEIR